MYLNVCTFSQQNTPGEPRIVMSMILFVCNWVACSPASRLLNTRQCGCRIPGKNEILYCPCKAMSCGNHADPMRPQNSRPGVRGTEIVCNLIRFFIPTTGSYQDDCKTLTAKKGDNLVIDYKSEMIHQVAYVPRTESYFYSAPNQRCTPPSPAAFRMGRGGKC